MIEWFRLVAHSDLIAHHAQGWEVSDDLADTHHGHHASLCRWPGEGEPPSEARTAEIKPEARTESAFENSV
jgi:hypothetical protein